ncbi:hypothetical protein F5Y16DRAFT_267166 [Xylariaceae sp. FL0255]|nr:hypothetical protein F5Y16DRAFT_267166 [Xylariaceae sp. FL0255]
MLMIQVLLFLSAWLGWMMGFSDYTYPYLVMLGTTQSSRTRSRKQKWPCFFLSRSRYKLEMRCQSEIPAFSPFICSDNGQLTEPHGFTQPPLFGATP